MPFTSAWTEDNEYVNRRAGRGSLDEHKFTQTSGKTTHTQLILGEQCLICGQNRPQPLKEAIPEREPWTAPTWAQAKHPIGAHVFF